MEIFDMENSNNNLGSIPFSQKGKVLLLAKPKSDRSKLMFPQLILITTHTWQPRVTIIRHDKVVPREKLGNNYKPQSDLSLVRRVPTFPNIVSTFSEYFMVSFQQFHNKYQNPWPNT